MIGVAKVTEESEMRKLGSPRAAFQATSPAARALAQAQ